MCRSSNRHTPSHPITERHDSTFVDVTATMWQEAGGIAKARCRFMRAGIRSGDAGNLGGRTRGSDGHRR
jgi:hypothetical protein